MLYYFKVAKMLQNFNSVQDPRKLIHWTKKHILRSNFEPGSRSKTMKEFSTPRHKFGNYLCKRGDLEKTSAFEDWAEEESPQECKSVLPILAPGPLCTSSSQWWHLGHQNIFHAWEGLSLYQGFPLLKYGIFFLTVATPHNQDHCTS